jgi:hypothetical protein
VEATAEVAASSAASAAAVAAEVQRQDAAQWQQEQAMVLLSPSTVPPTIEIVAEVALDVEMRAFHRRIFNLENSGICLLCLFFIIAFTD